MIKQTKIIIDESIQKIRGMTMIEIQVSLVIMALLLLVSFQFITTLNKVKLQTQRTATATQIAQDVIESSRNIPYDSLKTDTVNIDDIYYCIRDVEENEDIIGIKVTVMWPHTKQHHITISSLVAK